MKEMIMDPIQIMSGTNNMTHPLYVESAKALDGKNDKKTYHYIKNFVVSVQNGRKKVDMSPITKSNGDITNFAQYKAMQQGLEYLSMANSPLANDLKIILGKVEEYRPYYVDGYNRKMVMLTMEYEAMVMMLQSSISLALSTISLKKTNKGVALGTSAEISPNMKKLIHTTAVEMTKKTHKTMLDGLSKASTAAVDKDKVERQVKKEAVDPISMMAGAGGALLIGTQVIAILKNIVRGIFRLGISGFQVLKNFSSNYLNMISLVRLIAYAYYNKKVNKILKLEEQINFLKKSIEEIQLNKTISEEQKAEMIKKREAYIEMWSKKCEKMRAQFADVEDVATDQLHADDQKIRQSEKNADDEFVLEG